MSCYKKEIRNYKRENPSYKKEKPSYKIEIWVYNKEIANSATEIPSHYLLLTTHYDFKSQSCCRVRAAICVFAGNQALQLPPVSKISPSGSFPSGAPVREQSHNQ